MRTQSAVLRYLTALFAMIAMFSFASCKSAKKAEDEAPAATSAPADDNTLGDSDSGRAQGLQTVRFPYDSFNLDADGRATLKANADLLKDKPSVNVQIEGHADERGGIQYNIALGEKRANAVKKGLVSMGIAEGRLSTISYGKERPIDPGHNEAAWAKNRRANFAITPPRG